MQLHTSIKKRSLPWSCLSTDHPSSDSTLFSKAVSQLAAEGGGWLTWVVAVDDISKIKKVVGWQPKTSLDEVVVEIAEYLKSQ